MESLKVTEPGELDLRADAEHDGAFRARELLDVLFKRSKGMRRIFLLVLLAVALLVVLRRPPYEAQAAIMVDSGREYRPELGRERTPVPVTPEEVLNSEVQILTSESLIREVIERVGVERLYPSGGLLGSWLGANPHLRFLATGHRDLADLARRFRKDLSAEPVKRSSVIQVGFKHRDPVIAANALHVLVDTYKQRHLQVVYDESTLEFLQNRLRSYEDRLRDTERRWEAFRQEHGVFDYGQQMTLLLRQRADLVSSQHQTAVEVGDAERRLGSVNRALETPRPIEVQADIQKDSVRLQADAQSRRSRSAKLSRLLDDVNAQIAAMDRNQTQLAALRRELTENEKNYDMYKAKVEELRLSSDMNQHRISNVNVIDEGGVPTKPAGPGAAVKLAIGVVVALLSAAIYAFIAERAAQGLSTPEAAETRLKLPVLVTVRQIT